MANYNTTQVFTGLGTFDIGAPNIGTYTLNGSITLPRIASGDTATSALVVTVSINGGGAIYTGIADAQGFFIFPLVIASANSIIHVALTSAAIVDQSLNVIKTTITLSENT